MSSYLVSSLTILVFVVVAFYRVGHTDALFADQVGATDWLRTYVGQVTVFHYMENLPNRVIVAAKSGNQGSISVVASIDDTNGKLHWRRVLPEREVVTGLFSSVAYSPTQKETDASLSIAISVSIRAPYTKKSSYFTHIIRAWDAISGTILWEKVMTVSRQDQALGVVCQAQPILSVVAMVCGNDLTVVNALSGDVLWKWTPSSGVTEGGLRLGVTFVQGRPVVSVVGLLSGRRNAIAASITLDSKDPDDSLTDANMKERTISLLFEPESVHHMGIVLSRVVVFVSPKGEIAAYKLVGQGKNLSDHETVGVVRVTSSSLFFIETSTSSTPFTVDLTDDTISISKHSAFSGDGKGNVTATTALLDPPSTLLLSFVGTETGLLVTTTSISHNIKTNKNTMHTTKDMIPSLAVPFHGRVSAVAVSTNTSPTKQKQGDTTLRILIVTDDHQLSMCTISIPSSDSGNKTRVPLAVDWYRDEALASIKEVAFVDPPSQAPSLETNETKESLLQSLYDTIQYIREEVVSSVSGGVSGTNSVLTIHPLDVATLPSSSVEHSHPTRRQQNKNAPSISADPFGFRKVIVVVTHTARWFAIASENGQVLTSHLFVNPSFALSITIKSLMVTRESSSLTPECAVVITEHVHSEHYKSSILWFNPLDGSSIRRVMLDNVAIQSTLLPLVDDQHRHFLMVIDSTHRPYLFPDSSQVSLSKISSLLSKIFIYITDAHHGTLVGLGVRVETGESKSLELRSFIAWSLVLPTGDKIVALETRARDEAIHSPIHVSGEHSLLYKYLNPNLVAIVTTSRVAPPPDLSSSSHNKPSARSRVVNVRLVDGVTGKVISHVAHAGASAPISVVVSENWVAMSYWSTAHHRPQLSVIQLWEAAGVREETRLSPFLSFMRAMGQAMMSLSPISSTTLPRFSSLGMTSYDLEHKHSGRHFDPYASVTVDVRQQTFILPSGVSTLSVTLTAVGITNKQLLFGLKTGVVAAVDKRMIDPRSPIVPMREMSKMVAVEGQEGLAPYQARVQFLEHLSITYHHRIGSLRGIVTSSTHLESTSLVFVWGTDMFFARIMPSKGFDLLTDEFNYSLLLFTGALLLVGCVVSARMVSAKDLALSWA